MHTFDHLLFHVMILCLSIQSLPILGQDTAVVVVTVEDSTLIPEGLAYYRATNSFFVSSIHRKKIVEVDASSGEARDFIATGQNGFAGGVGLKVDEKADLLYALCFSKDDTTYSTGLYIYDLKTKVLILRIREEDGEPKLFNDLVLDGRGDLYITDTERSTIWRLGKNEGKLERFYSEPELYPNGIAVDRSNGILYLACWTKGIKALDISTGEAESIHPTVVSSQGIDGLYFHDGSLIGIHNRDGDRIIRYQMDKTGKCIGWEIIDAGNKYFDFPTTGVLAGDVFYCIANSQIAKLDQDHNRIKEEVALNPTYILSYELKKKKKKKK